MKQYRVEFSRNKKYKNEVAYQQADTSREAISITKYEHGSEIEIKEVCIVCDDWKEKELETENY